MGMFLNTLAPYELYKSVAADPYFVDKTALIGELLPYIGREKRYFCITRPRRFGKTVMANMLGAFFGKAADGKELFDKLQVAKADGYEKHLNSHHLIYLDFSRMPENCSSYERYLDRITNGLKGDLLEEFGDLKLEKESAVWDMLAAVFEKTQQKFIFVMDEWDAVFYQPFLSEQDQKSYLGFLRNLLKGQAYVELAYMTGILPIAKHSSGSELNMFVEYEMATKMKFGEYFGFLDSEVDDLYEKYRKTEKRPRISREELREWYDGYCTVSGERLYNPRSVVCALSDNQTANYWTSSGPYDEIFYYIQNNVAEVREDLVLMISGGRVEAKIQEYAATAKELNTKDQIYSAMVVYGLLTYEEGEVFIPNRELMDKFNDLLLNNESLGYVHRLAKESARMLKATLSGDTGTMAEILKYAHDTEAPIFSYNSEAELSSVVNLVYLSARDKYRVEREDKAGEGYVDFIFYPERKEADGIILELKVDHTADEAIAQIQKKRYALRFQGKLGEKKKYKGRILLVGIGYNRKTKEHSCKVEVFRQA